MLYRLVRPMKRKGSSRQHFAQRIPADLRVRMAGMKLSIPIGDEVAHVTVTKKMESIRFSLRTNDPSEVKERQASAASFVEKVFKSLRTDAPISLTHRNAVALSRDIYKSWASDFENARVLSITHSDKGWERNDTSPRMEELEAIYRSAIDNIEKIIGSGNTEELEKTLGPTANKLLLSRGMGSVDAPSRQMLLEELGIALRDGFAVRLKKAGSDYSHNSRDERFPEWVEPKVSEDLPAVSLTNLLELWWQEAETTGLTQSTYESYRKAMSSLVAFLKHDDARRVMPEDVVLFKDHLLKTPSPKTGKALSAKTVKDSYLSGLKSVFNWAVSNHMLPLNPATGITIKIGKKPKLRQTWFTHGETKAILSAALGVARSSREPEQRYAMKRWVPWLCAYTGARVGELVQLRKEDIRLEGEHWIITITPEAGTVKNKERRDVPLHPHLVELGFPDYVKSAPEGHLFMWSGTGRAAWRSAKNRLTAFVRTAVSDPNIQPNHAWRHTFKTIGSEVGIQDKVLDAICGHDPRTVGESYGGVTIEAKSKALSEFPKFKIT